MSGLFYRIFQNFVSVFKPRWWIWHLLAFVLTYLLVIFGVDFWYENFWHNSSLQIYLFPAAIVGFLVPVFLPVYFVVSGWVKKQPKTINLGFASVQAAFLGYLVSIIYKFFTGRPGPDGLFSRGADILDSSRIFHFGFYRGGIFFGWPSSHTTASVALGVALFILLLQHKYLKYLPLVYALYITFGVSGTIHWLSDVIAGIIFGSLVGISVGRSFKQRQYEQT